GPRLCERAHADRRRASGMAGSGTLRCDRGHRRPGADPRGPRVAARPRRTARHPRGRPRAVPHDGDAHAYRVPARSRRARALRADDGRGREGSLSGPAAALLPLSTASLTTLIVLGSAILLFLSGRVRPDLVALMVLASLAVGGVLTPREELAGFGRPAVVTLVGIFVVAQGLLLTGASARVGDLLARAGG